MFQCDLREYDLITKMMRWKFHKGFANHVMFIALLEYSRYSHVSVYRVTVEPLINSDCDLIDDVISGIFGRLRIIT